MIGERYKKARKFLGLTLKQVGKGAGISHTTVGHAERGRNPANYQHTQFLVENGINYYYLTGKSEEMEGDGVKLVDYVSQEKYEAILEELESLKKQLSESVPKEEYERLKIKYEALQETIQLKDKE